MEGKPANFGLRSDSSSDESIEIETLTASHPDRWSRWKHQFKFYFLLLLGFVNLGVRISIAKMKTLKERFMDALKIIIFSLLIYFDFGVRREDHTVRILSSDGTRVTVYELGNLVTTNPKDR